ncbi:MAG: ribonuclease D, partial [Pseudomonadota bacterium]
MDRHLRSAAQAFRNARNGRSIARPDDIRVIRDTDALAEFCEAARMHDFVCLDTEFMRETTFYSILCLIQMATPDDEVIV